MPETVVFVGESHVLDPADPAGLVFGRGADLDIDSNPFLHRQVGRFAPRGGVWWVENLSAWTPITVTGGGATATLTGGSLVALVHATTVIRFQAGSCNYELRALLVEPPAVPLPAPVAPEELTATYRAVDLPLTDEQRLLVLVLAERRLRDPEERYRLPSNASVARRLGWTDAKFNRKLDHLCRRLDKVGVAGMRNGATRANDRRLHLVDHMVASGMVTVDDLELLHPYPSASDDGGTG